MIDAPPAIHYTLEDCRAECSGEAVVLLNGGMMSGIAWEPVAQALAQHYRVLRLDFRGQLLSPSQAVPHAPADRPTQELPPDLEGHARDVVWVLDQLGIAKAHVVGTSFGALVGLALAAEHPDRVASLVAMNATARMSPEMVAGTRRLRELAREAAAGGDGGKIVDVVVPATYSPEWIAANQALLTQRRALVAAFPRTWFTDLDGILAALEHTDPSRFLGRIRAPSAVVGAEKDLTFPIANSEELARGIAGAKLRVVAGAPHGFVLERPAEAAALILELLAELGAGRKPGGGSRPEARPLPPGSEVAGASTP